MRGLVGRAGEDPGADVAGIVGFDPFVVSE
jgi:hypothetical protein